MVLAKFLPWDGILGTSLDVTLMRLWYDFLVIPLTASQILDTMDGLIKNGLDKVGFKYVNLDDCWQLVDRDDEGNIVPDPKAFPNGIDYLVQQAHDKNLKLGIYTDIGTKTCQGRAGSFGYYDIDAATYAKWEIDYLKCDFCFTPPEVKDRPWEFYSNFSQYLNKTGRHILFSICEWGEKDPATWCPAMSNSWRTTGDIQPNFESVLNIVEINEPLAKYAGNYNFNDPDMLEVGVVRGTQLTPVENKAHFSLWCMMAAPLLLGLDLRQDLEKDILDIITNTEIIAVSQDELGQQGYIVHEDKQHIEKGECAGLHCVWTQVWMKPLTDDRIAVMLFNHASKKHSTSSVFKDESISVNWEDLGLEKEKKMSIRDAWEKKDLGEFSEEFTSPNKITQHDVMVLILTPVQEEEE